MEILLIRHGETQWNRELVFRGRADIELSERGKKQAQLLGERLGSMEIDAIFSSPLLRATQTAAPAAERLGIDVFPDEALIDVDFGDWTGLSRDEVSEKFPDAFKKWHANPLEVSFRDGDVMREVQQRSLNYLREAAAKDYSRIAIVTHRVILKLLLVSILEASERAFWLIQFDTCSVSALEATGNSLLVKYLNDTHHLRPLAGAGLPDF